VLLHKYAYVIQYLLHESTLYIHVSNITSMELSVGNIVVIVSIVFRCSYISNFSKPKAIIQKFLILIK